MNTQKVIVIAAGLLLGAYLAFNFSARRNPGPRVASKPPETVRAPIRHESTAVGPLEIVLRKQAVVDAGRPPAKGDKIVETTLSQPAIPATEAANTEIPVMAKLYYAMSRAALAMVGADEEADEFWIAAINDVSFSPDQRKDLIEDLNEEGFEDPKNPTPEELPLIINRLALIEELAPDAMDDVNAAAFLEAYKDLFNMYQRILQR